MSDLTNPDYGTPVYGTPPEGSPQAPTDATSMGSGNEAVPPACSACGGQAMEPGFIEANGEGSRGFARWIPGVLEVGLFGGARRMGRQRFAIATLRCMRCQHLELYVGGAV